MPIKIEFYNTVDWLFIRSRATFNLKDICLLAFIHSRCF